MVLKVHDLTCVRDERTLNGILATLVQLVVKKPGAMLVILVMMVLVIFLPTMEVWMRHEGRNSENVYVQPPQTAVCVVEVTYQNSCIMAIESILTSGSTGMV